MGASEGGDGGIEMLRLETDLWEKKSRSGESSAETMVSKSRPKLNDQVVTSGIATMAVFEYIAAQTVGSW